MIRPEYYMATAYINEEFARIQVQNNEKNNRQEIDIENEILSCLINNPRIARDKLAERLGVTMQKVKQRLEKLQREGKISRKGSTKTGEWIATEQFKERGLPSNLALEMALET